MAAFDDPDFIAFIMLGIISFAVGDICGRAMLSWVNRAGTLSVPEMRYRRVEASSAAVLVIFLIALDVVVLAMLAPYLEPVGFISVILLCLACAFVTYYPHLAGAQAAVRVQPGSSKSVEHEES